MSYAILHTESGNMLEACSDRKSALALVASMLREDGHATDSLALLTYQGETLVVEAAGDELREAAVGATESAVAV